MRMRGARRFQMGGVNQSQPAVAPMNLARTAGVPPPAGGVNPIPAPRAQPGPAPGLDPRAIQQALAMRSGMAGGPPMLGGAAGVPQGLPLAGPMGGGIAAPPP